MADIFLRGTDLVTDAQGMASLVCTQVMLLPVISSDNEILPATNYFKFLLSVDRGATSFCPICSGVCSCDYSLLDRFSLLCSCFSQRFDSQISHFIKKCSLNLNPQFRLTSCSIFLQTPRTSLLQFCNLDQVAKI